MERSASEIIAEAIRRINNEISNIERFRPILIKRTVNSSAFDLAFEKEIRNLAKEAGLVVSFETKRHKVTRVLGYSRISDRAFTDTNVINQRIMWASKIKA